MKSKQIIEALLDAGRFEASLEPFKKNIGKMVTIFRGPGEDLIRQGQIKDVTIESNQILYVVHIPRQDERATEFRVKPEDLRILGEKTNETK